MRALYLLFLLTFLANTGRTQTTYAVWEDPNTLQYNFVQIDAGTGVQTNIAVIPGMTAFVAGDKTCIDVHNNRYIFSALISGNVRLLSLDLTTGAIVTDVPFNNQVVGFEYNCYDSTVYALEQTTGSNIVQVDYTTGMWTAVAPVPNITAYSGGAFTLDPYNQEYRFVFLENGIEIGVFDFDAGSIVVINSWPDNVVGHEFDCISGYAYGLIDTNNSYYLSRINPHNGTHFLSALLPSVTPGFISETHSIDENGNYVFQGFIGPDLYIISVDVNSGTVNSTVSFENNAVGYEIAKCCADSIVVEDTTALAEHVVQNLDVYPNPSSGAFALNLKQLDEAQLVVYDAMGKLLYRRNLIGSGKHIITDMELPAGAYTFTVTTGENKLFYRGRIIRQ